MTTITSPAEMIYETIVISTNADGEPHIAPFGVRERDGYGGDCTFQTFGQFG